MKIILNDQETADLKEVVKFVMEFERESYKEWIDKENPTGEGHVYHSAACLSDKIRDEEKSFLLELKARFGLDADS